MLRLISFGVLGTPQDDKGNDALLAEAFDEVVEEGLAFVEGLDGHALVAAVEADVVAVEKEALHAVGWNSRNSQIFAVGGAHDHHGDDGNAGPDFVGRFGDGLEEIGANRRGGAGFRLFHHFDADFVVADDLLQRAFDVLG